MWNFERSFEWTSVLCFLSGIMVSIDPRHATSETFIPHQPAGLYPAVAPLSVKGLDMSRLSLFLCQRRMLTATLRVERWR